MRSLLVSPDALERRRADLAASSDLKALDARLRAEVGEFVARPLYVPEAKALLSRWGSLCRDDGAELAFDPWSPDAQRCTRCENANPRRAASWATRLACARRRSAG